MGSGTGGGEWTAVLFCFFFSFFFDREADDDEGRGVVEDEGIDEEMGCVAVSMAWARAAALALLASFFWYLLSSEGENCAKDAENISK